MITKSHHFFLLEPSPWPFLASLSSFNLIFSILLFIKFSNRVRVFLAIFNVSWVSFFWWIFYGYEFNLKGLGSFSLDKGLKYSIILFITSEILFFFSFFWSYFHFFLSPSMETGLYWPPINIEIFNCLNVPLINTLILIRSGVTVTLSHYFLIFKKKWAFRIYLLVTILLGCFFTFLQGMEYSSSFFSIRDSNFGTSFFMLTGFHGLHVLIGTLFLTTALARSVTINFTNTGSLNFEMASWYWHFVDVVWIFLYFLVYYLNS